MTKEQARALLDRLTLEEKRQLNEFLKQLETENAKKDC